MLIFTNIETISFKSQFQYSANNNVSHIFLEFTLVKCQYPLNILT